MAKALLRIGEVAERLGISPDSIRHYERLGLLPAAGRTAAGYRLFGPDAVRRLQLVRSAVRAGFSLRQLAVFLGERERGGAPCRQVRAAAAQILAGVDAQIAELQASRAALRVILRDWDERVARTPAHQPAYLLEHLSAGGPPTSRRKPPSWRASR